MNTEPNLPNADAHTSYSPHPGTHSPHPDTHPGTALLNLLQLSDPSLPIGGYAHSGGLETYVQEGIVHNPATAREFVQQMLSTSLHYTDAALLSLAHEAARNKDHTRLAELDRLAEAVKLPKEIREASRLLGRRLLTIFTGTGAVPHPTATPTTATHPMAPHASAPALSAGQAGVGMPRTNFVGAASPRSSSFLTFASLGYLSMVNSNHPKSPGKGMHSAGADVPTRPESPETETTRPENLHYAIAFGYCAATLNIPLNDALTGFYYNAVAGMVTNCVKLIPIGQQDGQKILFSLQPLIQQLTEKSQNPDEQLIGLCCAGLDIRCMQHERLYSRLYMS